MTLDTAVSVRKSPTAAAGTELTVVLGDGFSLLTLSSFMAPFEIANRVANHQLFRWRFASSDGKHVMSNLGVPFPVGASLQGCATGRAAGQVVALVMGDAAAERPPRPLLSSIRLWHRRGIPIAALDAAPWIVATAGLMESVNCTIHWHRLAAFAQTFPRAALNGSLVAEEKGIWTGAGETAGFDLAIRLIESIHSDAHTSNIVKWALRAPPAQSDPRQPTSAGLRFRHLNAKLAEVIAIMEANVEEPLGLQVICSMVVISRRHLERIFNRHAGMSPHRFYVAIRLEHSKLLLRQTTLPLIEICLSCGFATVSHFAKTFKTFYGCSPTDFRRGGRTVADALSR